MGILHRLVRWARQFKAGESGVAAVEFALILPIMLLLYAGMVEGSTLITIDRKVQTVSGSVGDLVARSNGMITSKSLGDYVKVASGIMTPYSDTELVQVVTQVFVDNNGKATVDWSRPYVGQVAKTTGGRSKGSTYPLPADVVAISRGQYLIVTECSLSYKPLFGFVFDQAINLYRENFFVPRFREQIKLDP